VRNYLKKGNGDLAQVLVEKYAQRMTPAQRQRFDALLRFAAGDGDGVLDVSDVMALANAINSLEELDASIADVNGDGVVDVFDVMALYNSIQSGS